MDETKVEGLEAQSIEEQHDNSSPVEDVMDKPQSTSGEEKKEPGWFKTRWAQSEKQLEARIRAQYEQEFAPIKEQLMEMKAKELVANGEVKDLETAKELVAYRQGNPVAPKPAPRAQEDDPVIVAKAQLLGNQADRIKAKRGIDVMEVFDNDPEIREQILSGEMDFYELADQIASERKAGRPPAPTRSPNKVSSANNPISSMSKAEWERLEKNLDQGARYSL